VGPTERLNREYQGKRHASVVKEISARCGLRVLISHPWRPRSEIQIGGFWPRWTGSVRKVQQYLNHADECRELARTASGDRRQALEEMARTWEQLAVMRERRLHAHRGDDKDPD
jgi:hypothetical protein